jgi:hypothetical protein
MGQGGQIANLPVTIRTGKAKASFRRPSKQRFGRSAVGSSLVAVRDYAGDFCLQQGDAFAQFSLRIGGEILGSEATRGIS